MTTEEKTCASCQYSVERESTNAPDFWHECHRAPPLGWKSLWPVVRAVDWCGEYLARKTEKK